MNPSIQKVARAGGILYLVIIITGLFGEIFVRSKLIVPGDPASTAANIMASQLWWRLGISGDLIMHICDVPLALIFYILFKPVNQKLAALALLFNLLSSTVLVAITLNLVMVLFPLGQAAYLKSFSPEQLQTMAYLAFRSHGYGFAIGLVFFGIECLVLGYLIYQSDFLPKVIGVMMFIAGLCYLLNSFSMIISPTFVNKIYPYVLIPAFVGESSFCLWLLIKGGKKDNWEQRLHTTLHGLI
jgi:hypothetical protein